MNTINIVYFRHDHTASVTCQGELGGGLKLTWSGPVTWAGLAEELEAGGQYVAVHIDTMTSAPMSSATEFMDALTTVIKFIPNSEKIKIVVIVTKDTPVTVIRELQKTRCQGILLDISQYSIMEATPGFNAFFNGIPYWPKEIINKLPNEPKKPLHVYFREDYQTYITPEMDASFRSKVNLDVEYCSTWDELGQTLAHRPHQLVFHIDTLNRLDISLPEIMSMLAVRLKLIGLTIPIGVGIEPTTPLRLIKELKKAGVHGIVPSAAHWGVEEAVAAIHSLADRIAYWPKHILRQLPGNIQKPKVNDDSIALTNRQDQILNLLRDRGLSNKLIARTLGITESTVKLHIGAILKKYNAKNRTQLVAFSKGS